MDIEALQAQIDLSNAIAYDVVSSWMKPSTSTSTVSNTISKELEEYAKRPPRLGLGAKVSKSSIATSLEAARLKGKLTDQKRTRNEAIMKGPEQSRDDEDEDESRSSAIKSKKKSFGLPRALDILGKGKGKARGLVPNVGENSTAVPADGEGNMKKRKRHQADLEDIPDASASPVKHATKTNPFVIPETPTALTDQSTISLVIPTTTTTVESVDNPSPSKKRKKKHKRKDRNIETGDVSLQQEEEEWTGFSPSLLEDINTIISRTEELSIPPKSSPPGGSSVTPSIKATLKPSVPSSTSIVAISSASHLQRASVSSTHPTTTLLNLDGPLSEDMSIASVKNQTEQSPSSKKKRTRRRRMKGKK